MTWLVWDSGTETEADAIRIDASDCEDACEKWAQIVADADTANVERHLRNGLDLRARRDGEGQVHKIVVKAEAEVNYHAWEM